MEKTLQERIDQKALRIQALYQYQSALIHRIDSLMPLEAELLANYSFDKSGNRDTTVYNRLQQVTAQLEAYRASLEKASDKILFFGEIYLDALDEALEKNPIPQNHG